MQISPRERKAGLRSTQAGKGWTAEPLGVTSLFLTGAWPYLPICNMTLATMPAGILLHATVRLREHEHPSNMDTLKSSKGPEQNPLDPGNP